MKYLIFGGNGFLGTNLSLMLLDNAHSVHCVDSYVTSAPKRIDHPGYRCTAGDINDASFMQSSNFDGIDYIFNLACPASPPRYMQMPIYTLDTCYIGVKNIFNLALELEAPVLHSSTSEIYGDPSVHPQHEEYFGNVNTMGPRSCYDEGKRVAEALCYTYSSMGLKVHVARIFNTYGPFMDMNDRRVVSEFIIRALTNKPLIINGDGSSTRSFCYAQDLCDAFLLLSSSEYYGSPINLGNPKEFTLLELAHLIKQKTNSNSDIIFAPALQDDPKLRRPDISKASNLLNWSPKIDLDSGLNSTIKYFSNQLSDYSLSNI